MCDEYYNYLAEDFHLKRKNPWKALDVFLIKIRTKFDIFNGFIVDIGCGNGRNIPLLKTEDNKIIGIDNSLELIKIARKASQSNSYPKEKQNKAIQFILSDFLYLPIRKNRIETIASIASLHHVRSKSNRKKAVLEMCQILKEGGYLILSIWRRYQKKYKLYFLKDYIKKNISLSYNRKQKALGLQDFGDKLVPWTVAKNNLTYNRFYHFFSKFEIKRLLSCFKLKIIEKLGGPNQKDNFFILARK